MKRRIKIAWEKTNRDIPFQEKKYFNSKTIIYGFFRTSQRSSYITEELQVMFWKIICLYVAETARFTNLFGGLVKTKIKEK